MPVGVTVCPENHVAFPVEITPEEEGKPISLKLKLDLLVCKDLCMPGEQKLSIALPVSETAQAANQDQFSKLGFNGPVSSITGGAASLGANAANALAATPFV